MYNTKGNTTNFFFLPVSYSSSIFQIDIFHNIYSLYTFTTLIRNISLFATWCETYLNKRNLDETIFL